MDAKETASSVPELPAGNCETQQSITLSICPITGGTFDLEVRASDSVEELRKKIARHLQTPKERLTILFKEKVLTSGMLADQQIQDGNKITLLPSVESGFSSTVQGTQQSIIQAIESLSDVQIDDFLSGRSPLTLALRVGDHMMFVQLQLEQSMVQGSNAGTTPTTHPSVPGRSGQRSSRHNRHRSHHIPGFPPRCSPDHSAALNCLPPSLWTNNPAFNPISRVPASVTSSLSPENETTKFESSSSESSQRDTSTPLAAASGMGGPTTGLLYKTTACPSLKRAAVASLPHLPLDKPSHLDKLVTACSSLGTSTSQSSSSQKSSSGKAKMDPRTHSSRRTPSGTPYPTNSQNYHYRRASTTSGKITSGVGSLTHNSSLNGVPIKTRLEFLSFSISNSAGTPRVMRQMQRLRRLCGAHQQCVAYSSPELASEISSIVHAAKHHSSSDNSAYHRRSNGKSSQKERPRSSQATTSSPTPSVPAAGASIDSFTTHGPGIFSGTFSGSLHPNIQDNDGRPKRDPQTILQILTDLLSATNHYQGQAGNIGMLPQLLKDHFTKQQAGTSATNEPTRETPTPPAEQEAGTSRPQHSRSRHPQHFPHPYLPQQFNNTPYVYPYLPGSQTGVPHSYAAYQHMAGQAAVFHHYTHNNGIVTPPDNCYHHQRVSGKCPHRRYGDHHAGSSSSKSRQSPYWCCCSSSSSRRSSKQAPHINMGRLKQLQQENNTTRSKLQQLTHMMQERRMRRKMRREACAPYGKPNHASCSGAEKAAESNALIASPEGDSSEPSGLEVQIDNLHNYADDRKSEVALESPETVTV
uniref:midnolin homolog isoform X1 n=1 Tax=Ciona intestinalis TaxID=7719 RepID=UPI00089DB7C1|nr:midnolin homolog isoform X1 [Ciona intestinalis]|eukprot:XP_018668499.1 midnolin homolog isoform X1 [Ciona intestinalis]